MCIVMCAHKYIKMCVEDTIIFICSHSGSSRAMMFWLRGEAVYCALCHMWLNGPTQHQDHLIGKKHKKNKTRWQFFHSLARFTLESVVDTVLLEFEEARVFAQTAFALRIVMRSPVKWFTPVKAFLLECIRTSITHSDSPLDL